MILLQYCVDSLTFRLAFDPLCQNLHIIPDVAIIKLFIHLTIVNVYRN